MEQIAFWMIVISGLLPVAYMATSKKFPLLCKIVVLCAVIYGLLPIPLMHTEIPHVVAIAPPVGGVTTLWLYFLTPPRA